MRPREHTFFFFSSAMVCRISFVPKDAAEVFHRGVMALGWFSHRCRVMNVPLR